jgi:hypothetical protein
MFIQKNDNKNPKLVFDLNNGIIKIIGRSTMKQPQEFYPSVISLIEEYCENPAEETKLIIDLEYYNILSSRYLLKIVDVLSNLQHKHKIKISWHYNPDDIDIAKDIQLFSKIIRFDIKAIAYELA